MWQVSSAESRAVTEVNEVIVELGTLKDYIKLSQHQNRAGHTQLDHLNLPTITRLKLSLCSSVINC